MRNPIVQTLWAGAALGLLGLAGCDQIDPLKRPYMWKASGVNQQNITAMVVRPGDLTQGRGSDRRRAVVEAEGVEHLWSGKLTPLHGSGGSGGGASGGASGGYGGSAGAGGSGGSSGGGN